MAEELSFVCENSLCTAIIVNGKTIAIEPFVKKDGIWFFVQIELNLLRLATIERKPAGCIMHTISIWHGKTAKYQTDPVPANSIPYPIDTGILQAFKTEDGTITVATNLITRSREFFNDTYVEKRDGVVRLRSPGYGKSINMLVIDPTVLDFSDGPLHPNIKCIEYGPEHSHYDARWPTKLVYEEHDKHRATQLDRFLDAVYTFQEFDFDARCFHFLADHLVRKRINLAYTIQQFKPDSRMQNLLRFAEQEIRNITYGDRWDSHP